METIKKYWMKILEVRNNNKKNNNSMDELPANQIPLSKESTSQNISKKEIARFKFKMSKTIKKVRLFKYLMYSIGWLTS